MGSTYLRRPCKPWPRFDRDTCRVNESPREAREHFASRYCFKKNEFRITVVVVFFLNEEEAIPPPPLLRVYYIGIPMQRVKK